jgi:DNA-binding GntR family transcriptional regulator
MKNLGQPVIPRSLVDELVSRLENAIITGELAPGTLVREQTLARSLGVSRGPLREAVRRLEGRKLLQRTTNVGPKVIDLSIEDLREVWVVREGLEGLACGLAARHMTDAEIDQLDDIVAFEIKALKADKWHENYEETNTAVDFHRQIVLGSRNQRLVQLVTDDLGYLLKVYRYRTMIGHPQRAEVAIQEHKAIIRALRMRDPALAEMTMRAHIRNSLESVLQQPDQMAPAEAPSPQKRAVAQRRSTARRT